MAFEDILKRVRKFARMRFEMRALELIKSPKFGLNKNKVRIITDQIELGKERKNYGYFYYYQGPLDEKTRDFCRAVLTLDKIFSEADITLLSQVSGYDVKKYEGSYNCRHQWIKFRGEVVDTLPPTDNQINKIGNKAI